MEGVYAKTSDGGPTIGLPETFNEWQCKLEAQSAREILLIDEDVDNRSPIFMHSIFDDDISSNSALCHRQYKVSFSQCERKNCDEQLNS